MEIRIGREKRHLEVGEKQHREEEEAPVAEQVQLMKVGEGFYGLPVGPGLFCFFIFLFIPKPCSCFEVCNNHMASPCHLKNHGPQLHSSLPSVSKVLFLGYGVASHPYLSSAIHL